MIQAICVFVGDRPRFYWDTNPARTNKIYLDSLDPGYFLQLANWIEQSGDEPSQPIPAIAVRHLYLQSLECMFAMAFALVQAHQYPVGWLVGYRNEQLEYCLHQLSKHAPLAVTIRPPSSGWKGLFSLVMKASSKIGSETLAHHAEQSRLAVRYLAQDFTHFAFKSEYNAIKHGLRVQPGGFTLAMGKEAPPGKPAPPENMMTYASSKTGSSFFVQKDFEQGRKKVDFRLEHHSVNWSLAETVARLKFATLWILNLQQVLRITATGSTDGAVHLPDDDLYKSVRDGSNSVFSSSLRMNFKLDKGFELPTPPDPGDPRNTWFYPPTTRKPE